MPSRNWNVPIDLTERRLSGDVTPVDVAEAQQAFLDAESLLRTIGGIVQVGPHRVDVGDDRWITVGYSFRWDSFARGIRLEPREGSMVEDADEALEPEPVEA